MKVDISTRLTCRPAEAMAEAKTTRLLEFVTNPLVTFKPVVPSFLPEIWAEGRYWVELKLFGFIPFGRQAIEISYPPAAVFTLRDNGHSALIPTWDHVVTVEPAGNDTRYRDLVIVEAGLLTPFVWLFAQAFYRHRQRRWRQLARSGFNYAHA